MAVFYRELHRFGIIEANTCTSSVIQTWEAGRVSRGAGMLREGQIVVGPQFSEPVVVETVRADGVHTWVVGLVGEGRAHASRWSSKWEAISVGALEGPLAVNSGPLEVPPGAAFFWSVSVDGKEVQRVRFRTRSR